MPSPNQVAQALERARLMEQTQRSAVELQAVAEVGTATATILEPQSLLQRVVDLTKDRFGLYHAHIYLLEEDENNLVLTAGAGTIGRSMVLEGWSIPFEKEDSIVARTARIRQGQIVADVEKEPGFLRNPLLPETRSELAVPIIVADKLLGVFDVQSNVLSRFTRMTSGHIVPWLHKWVLHSRMPSSTRNSSIRLKDCVSWII